MNNLKKIVIFDFDSTLVNTMGQEEGNRIWLEKKGTKFPHKGWWSRNESLDTEVFSHPLNDDVYKEYLKYIHQSRTGVYLVTGRLEKLKPKVLNIVDMHKLSFDGIHCNNKGVNTFTFKSDLFEEMILSNPSIKEFIIYDDRAEQIFEFNRWMMKMNTDIKITIYDVVNNSTLTNYINN